MIFEDLRVILKDFLVAYEFNVHCYELIRFGMQMGFYWVLNLVNLGCIVPNLVVIKQTLQYFYFIM